MIELLSAPGAGWLLLAAFTGLSLAILTERLTRKAKEDQALRRAAERLVEEVQHRNAIRRKLE